MVHVDPYDYKNTEKYLKSTAYKTMDCELKRPTYKDITKSYPKRPRNKCPCPECVGDDRKAWAEVCLDYLPTFSFLNGSVERSAGRSAGNA